MILLNRIRIAIDRFFFRLLDNGRHCSECAADIVGNDPHYPTCSKAD